MPLQAQPSTRVVLSGARSVTHLVYAASWLRHVVAGLEAAGGPEGAVEVVVLDVGSGFGRATVGEAEVREHLPQHPRLRVTTSPRDEHWRASKGLDRVLLSIGVPGTRAWARLFVGGRGRRPLVVVVDEGIGSFGNRRSRREAYRRQGGSSVRAAVRAAVVSAGARALTDVHWSLYERTSTTWRVREEVAAEFRRALSGSSPGAEHAVYLTQPWPDIGVMSESVYLAHLRSVRDECAAIGVPLVLRPHPSEDVARYAGFELLASPGPAELAREVVEATVVIGANSTALLNLAAVHGTRAVRVTAPELRGLEAGLTTRQRTLLDTFLPPASGVPGVGAALQQVMRSPRRGGAAPEEGRYG